MLLSIDGGLGIITLVIVEASAIKTLSCETDIRSSTFTTRIQFQEESLAEVYGNVWVQI